jgi:hypothetical protein
MPPSPVFCRQPAIFAPRLMACTALAESEPKLMADVLTIESGRNALRRLRGPPSTLLHGTRQSGALP